MNCDYTALCFEINDSKSLDFNFFVVQYQLAKITAMCSFDRRKQQTKEKLHCNLNK